VKKKWDEKKRHRNGKEKREEPAALPTMCEAAKPRFARNLKLVACQAKL